MDVSLYLEVRDLFRSKWDPAILDVLSERPYRFLALARRVRLIIGGSMEQVAVNRALSRLQEAGYIHATPANAGARDISIYELTDEGHQALATYRAILCTFEQMRPPEARCASTAPDVASSPKPRHDPHTVPGGDSDAPDPAAGADLPADTDPGEQRAPREQ